MEDFKQFLKNKRNLVNLIILLVLILAIPVGIELARRQQELRSRAEEPPIAFAGDCITQRGDRSVAKCSDVTLRLTSPLGPPGTEQSPSPSPSSSSSVSPSPSPSASPSSPPGVGGDFRVFVTSSTFQGNLGGISGANQKCNDAARSLGGRWVAWLSDNTQDIKNVLPDGKYALLNNEVISNNKAGLFDGRIDNRINVNQSRATVGNPKEVWTGTKKEGVNGERNCNNWSSSSRSQKGMVGKNDSNSGSWTNASSKECDGAYRLYCFEVEKPRPSPSPSPSVAPSPSPSPSAQVSASPSPSASPTTKRNSWFDKIFAWFSIVYAQDDPDDTDDPDNPDTHDPPPTGPNDDDGGGGGNSQCRKGGKGCKTDNECCSKKCVKDKDNQGKEKKKGKCSAASPSPSSSSSSSASSSGQQAFTGFFRVADTQSGLNNAAEQVYDDHPEIYPYNLGEAKGNKIVWVRFISPSRAITRDVSATIELVGPDPLIDNVKCAKTAGRDGITFKVKGTNFGNSGTLSTVLNPESSASANININNWKDDQVVGVVPVPDADEFDEGTQFPLKLTRSSDRATTEASCLLGEAFELNLGAKLFCRAPSQFATTDVDLKIYEADTDGEGQGTGSHKLTKSEKVTIDKNGAIRGSQFKYKENKEYVLSVKAPRSLRRNTPPFLVEGGSNFIHDFELPVGDIFPRDKGDGRIDTFDLSELIRQWGISRSNTPRTADFNLDNKTNSFDFGCMRYYLRDTDDPEPD